MPGCWEPSHLLVRSQFRASGEKRDTLWLPSSSLLWAPCQLLAGANRLPGGRGQLCVREDSTQTRMVPLLSGWKGGPASSETSSRQVSFPGFLPPGHFQVPKLDPGPWPPPPPQPIISPSTPDAAVSRTPPRSAHPVPAGPGCCHSCLDTCPSLHRDLSLHTGSGCRFLPQTNPLHGFPVPGWHPNC